MTSESAAFAGRSKALSTDLLRERWVFDRDWIADIVSAAARFDAVTLDVFDTAITRLVDSPVDVFALVEDRLTASPGAGKGFAGEGFAAKGFAAEREAAEVAARRRATSRAAEDVTLDQIYRQLRLPHADLDKVKALEMQIEREVCVAVPDIRELVAALRAAGKAVAFVSDMYLPGRFIEELLRDNGYDDLVVFVSCETGQSKAVGTQWSNVKRHFGARAGILHIGDDIWSDVERPRAFGIETRLYARAKSERRVGAPIDPNVLPFSLATRKSTLLASAERVSDGPRWWRELGATFGSLLVGAFVSWLAARIETHKVDKIFFCARDGWLMKRAWEAAGFQARTGIACEYFYISRRPLNFARGFLDSTETQLAQHLVEFIASTYIGNGTHEEALHASGLQDCLPLRADLLEAFGSLDAKCNEHPDNITRFREALIKNTAHVYAVVEREYDKVVAYLRTVWPSNGGRAAIVDMGWHGTIQAGLGKLLDAVYGEAKLVGFYYGLWPPASGNRLATGPMEAAFCSDFDHPNEWPEFLTAIEILEELHSAPHGTVISYSQEATGWGPVLADSPGELAQYESITTHFQQGVVEAIESIFSDKDDRPYDRDELTIDAARAAISALSLSPSAKEIEMIGSLVHCATFDHAVMLPIVPPVPPDLEEARMKAIHQCIWRPATLRTWLDRTSGEERLDIQRMARHVMHYLSPRQLSFYN